MSVWAKPSRKCCLLKTVRLDTSLFVGMYVSMPVSRKLVLCVGWKWKHFTTVTVLVSVLLMLTFCCATGAELRAIKMTSWLEFLSLCWVHWIVPPNWHASKSSEMSPEQNSPFMYIGSCPAALLCDREVSSNCVQHFCFMWEAEQCNPKTSSVAN